MCSSSRKPTLAGAGALLVACMFAGCGTDSQPAPPPSTAAALPPLRTLYVQAPLSGPAAGEGRAMVDAVRLVVDQHGGLAGKVRVVVRAQDDGGRPPFATEAARCARNAARAAGDPSALAVIGTYELACSKRALRILRPAGLWLVSPVNAANRLPGALRLAPTVGDEGTAAAQLASSLGATRIAVVSQRPAAGTAFESALVAGAAAAGAEPVLELDASASTPQDIARRAARRAHPDRRACGLARNLGRRSPARPRSPAGGGEALPSSPPRPSTRSRSSTERGPRPTASG